MTPNLKTTGDRIRANSGDLDDNAVTLDDNVFVERLG